MTMLAQSGWFEGVMAAGLAVAGLALAAGCGLGLIVWFAGRRAGRR